MATNKDALIVDTIRGSVSPAQAAQSLGIRIGRNGRCACPVHGGRNPNCALGERWFYCHKCHAHGDVIDLVRAVNGCTFPEAIRWLDSAFNLGLPIDRPIDQKAAEAAQIARKRKQEQRARKEAIDRMLFDLYLDAVRLCGDIENDVVRFAPVRDDAEWDERFCVAMRLLPKAREAVEALAVAVYGSKERERLCGGGQ